MNSEIAPSLKSIPFLKDAPGRALRAAGREASWFSLPAGAPLYLLGEPADSIFFVLSGSLGAFRPGPDGTNEFLGHIRPGEPVGEMALFSGGHEKHAGLHEGSVYALRDSEVLRISRAGFDRLIKAEPEILERLIRVILVRLRLSGRRSQRAEPKVFTMVATSPTIDLELRAQALKAALHEMNLRVAVIDERRGDQKPSTFFDELEANHDIVILLASVGDSAWYQLSIRQADRIWVFGRADAVPSQPLIPADNSPARQFKLVDVVLLHQGRSRMAATPQTWLSACNGVRVFHWGNSSGPDCQRLARVMTGRSVGLVLSGGGARAFAHIGVVRALRERGIPIDFAGGTSMGAVVAGCVAMGWSDEEIDRRIRKSFVETNPLGDYCLPVVGLVRGHRVNTRLQEHFGETEIGDLKIPFFAVSANLTDGSYRVHRDGLLRKALRASISLPGILPPVVDEGEVLVDGGVLNNFPANVMRDLHRGFIVGSDVARQREGFSGMEFENPPGFFRWVMKNGFSRTPPIASLLMRAATVSVNPSAGAELTDVLISPEIDDLELRDWEAYDEAVQAGYDAAMAGLGRCESVFRQPGARMILAAE